MKKNIFNVLYFIIIVLCLIFSTYKFDYISILNIVVLFIPFFISNIFKIFKQYIIFLNNSIHFRDVIHIYTFGTFLNSLIPYKIGEIVKMLFYGKKINRYTTGITGIIIDKIFDSFILLTIMLIVELKGSNVSILLIFLLIFICLVLFAYFSFDKIFNFLNNYLIIYKNNKLSVKLLNILNTLNSIYIDIKQLIKNKGFILILLSIFSWSFELIFVYLIQYLFYNNYDSMNFINYINGSFLGFNNSLSKYYTIEIVILSFMGYVYFMKRRKGELK